MGQPDGTGTPAHGALAYLMTFHTYGTWLRGDIRGSVDRHSNQFGTPYQPPCSEREDADRRRLSQSPIVLAEEERGCVSAALAEVCRHRVWELVAADVRTHHVHVVIRAARTPEHVMNTLKSWSTRRLIEAGHRPSGTRTWARHGSTRYLFSPPAVDAARRYVLEQQGRPTHARAAP